MLDESTQKWAREYNSGREYADPKTYLGRRLQLFEHWGPRPQPGSHVLQIGCGDGYFAGLLLSQGYQVTACDNSPELLQKTENSNKAAVNKGRLTTALVDVNNSFSFDDRFDHTIAVMRSFFRYCRRPNAALRELRDLTRGKLIIDVDPRKYDLQRAWQQIADAGFSPLERRAFLTPQKRRLPRLLQKSMWLFERTPIVYRPLLKRKFHVWILAENETLRDE